MHRIARLNTVSLFGGTEMYDNLLFFMKQCVSTADRMRILSVNH